MKQVIITIKEDGAYELEASGFKGKDCDVTKPLEAALGVPTGRKNKADYYQQATTGQQKIGGAS